MVDKHYEPVEPSEIVDRLLSECLAAGSQREWARRNDMSAAYVCDVLSGRRDVTDRIAKKLGYVRVSYWRDQRSAPTQEKGGGNG